MESEAATDMRGAGAERTLGAAWSNGMGMGARGEGGGGAERREAGMHGECAGMRRAKPMGARAQMEPPAVRSKEQHPPLVP